MSEVLKKFGRYFLLDQMAQGGMAEIYRARLAAQDGAGRLLVIKRIQAGFGSNTEFLQMFRSETKVMMGFNHPNIVQLYDYGEENQQPYIAMEWVDGKNLRQFMSRFNELKQPFPVELAAYIIEQAASGLHYAHNFRDKISGEPLNIVHRDISPQNVLISYEGNVKVIDFGIAKANTNVESTRAGVIKGKPSYLSPEQISGELLDGRCDIFALGTVLWELLAGKKLFAGENDLAVLKLIESAQTHVKPPSTLNPKVPKELDYIVLRALAKSREKRYQTGEELQRALHKFLYSFAPEFNPSDLSYYARDLFKNEIVEDRKKIQRLNDKVEQLLAQPQSKASSERDGLSMEPIGGSEEAAPKEDTTTVVEPHRSRASGAREAFDPGQIRSMKVELDPIPLKPASGQRPRHTSANAFPSPGSQASTAPRQTVGKGYEKAGATPGANAKALKQSIRAVAALVGVVLLAPELGISIPYVTDLVNDWTGSGQARVVLQGNQKDVVVELNGTQVAKQLPATIKEVPVGSPFVVSVRGPQGSYVREVTLAKGEKKVLPVELTNENRGMASAQGLMPPTQLPTGIGGGVASAGLEGGESQAQPPADSGNSISLRLNVMPGGGTTMVTLNGRTVDHSKPIRGVPLDAPLELVADRHGFKPFRREFVLETRQLNGLKEWLMDVTLEPLKFGFLTLHVTPSAEAIIMVEGKPWVRKTPIENEKFPVGTYPIRLVNEVLGMEKNLTVTIQEGKFVSLEERLEIKDRAPAGGGR